MTTQHEELVDRYLAAWIAPEAGGAPAMRGVDFAMAGPDGRLASVAGFLDA